MDDASLRVWAANALHGLIGESLVRVSVGYSNNVLEVQTVILSNASEEEIEDYRCFTSELLSNFYDSQLVENIIPVPSVEDASNIDALPVKVFDVGARK